MTVALEHVQDGDWAAVNRDIDALARLVLDTGGRSLGIRVGTTTVTFAGGSQNPNFPTVTHGLGRTPVGLWLTATSTAVNLWAWGGSLGATTFVIGSQTAAAAPVAGTTATIAWVVIG